MELYVSLVRCHYIIFKGRCVIENVSIKNQLTNLFTEIRVVHGTQTAVWVSSNRAKASVWRAHTITPVHAHTVTSIQKLWHDWSLPIRRFGCHVQPVFQ